MPSNVNIETLHAQHCQYKRKLDLSAADLATLTAALEQATLALADRDRAFDTINEAHEAACAVVAADQERLSELEIALEAHRALLQEMLDDERITSGFALRVRALLGGQ